MAQISPLRRSAAAGAAPRADVSQKLPQLGSWQLVRLAGEGSMARVYQARPAGRGEPQACYAVKQLKPQWEDNPAAVELLRREAVAGHKFAHPHLVSVLDWQIAEPPYFVVMPLLCGSTLLRLLEARRLPAPTIALWIARQVAQALETLHAERWMHGDIKPANIFIGLDGHATLLDLGYARPCSDGTAVADRPLLGTLDYMAPEMFTSSLAGDIRSDLYSLGVVLYQLLTGRLPFQASNPAQVARLQREAVPERLRSLNPQVPRSVAELVHQMLSKEPLRRPQTPGELVARLVSLEIETFAERFGA